MALVDRTCETCGVTFSVKPYRAVPGPRLARFCSGACRGKWVASLPHVQARNRGPKPYMLGNQLRRGLPPANAFKPGAIGPQKPRMQFECEFCGGGFGLAPWEVRRRSGQPRFCTRECFEQSGCFQGAGSPTYAGGPTTIRGENWRIIRAVVVEEQAGECGHCGVLVGPSLHVHHKRPFRLFSRAEDANRRENLIGLCARCHRTEESRVERILRAELKVRRAQRWRV